MYISSRMLKPVRLQPALLSPRTRKTICKKISPLSTYRSSAAAFCLSTEQAHQHIAKTDSCSMVFRCCSLELVQCQHVQPS